MPEFRTNQTDNNILKVFKPKVFLKGALQIGNYAHVFSGTQKIRLGNVPGTGAAPFWGSFSAGSVWFGVLK